jgi:hypothetical protein
MATNAPDAASQIANLLTSVAVAAIQHAAQQASAAPERLTQALTDALSSVEDLGDTIAELPDQVVDRLRDAVDSADWLAMLTFVLVRLVDLVDDPALTVVAHDPGAGWAKAVGVRWMPTGDVAMLLVSFAVGGAGHNGMAIEVRGAPSFERSAGAFTVAAKADGDGSWRFGFGTPVAAPAAAASFSISAGLANDLLPPSDNPLILALGRPRIAATAGSQPMKWEVLAAFENEGGGPGVRAAVDLAPMLGVLGEIVNLTPIDERYRPTVRFGSETSPMFDLNHEGF